MKFYQKNFEENTVLGALTNLFLYILIYFTPNDIPNHPSLSIYTQIILSLIVIARVAYVLLNKRKDVISYRVTNITIIINGLFWSVLYIAELYASDTLTQKSIILSMMIVGIASAACFGMYKKLNLLYPYLIVLIVPSAIFCFSLLDELNVIFGLSFIFFGLFMLSYVRNYNKVWNEFKFSKVKLQANNIELDKALNSVKAASKAKSEFLANMSHEIRTPMNGIIGATEILQSMDLSKDEKNILSVISRSGDALLNIINDILDFSKIEAGKLDIENYPFNLYKAVENIIEQLSFRANEDGLELMYYIKSDVPEFIEADEGRLLQILINLVGNSIKFTENGEILLRVELAERDGDDLFIKFSVEDTGIGIPEEKLKVIFDSFTQADGSTTRKYGGTGLGTTISRMLVELMNGTIWVESPNVNIEFNSDAPGSIFHFIIKCKEHVAIEKEFDKNLDTYIKGINVLVVDDQSCPKRFNKE